MPRLHRGDEVRDRGARLAPKQLTPRRPSSPGTTSTAPSWQLWPARAVELGQDSSAGGFPCTSDAPRWRADGQDRPERAPGSSPAASRSAGCSGRRCQAATSCSGSSSGDSGLLTSRINLTGRPPEYPARQVPLRSSDRTALSLPASYPHDCAGVFASLLALASISCNRLGWRLRR